MVDPQHPDACAVIDRCVLVEPFAARAWERLDELDVDLHAMAGERFLVALPTSVVALVALRCGEPAEIEVAKHRDTVPDLALLVSFIHVISLIARDPGCNEPPSVPYGFESPTDG